MVLADQIVSLNNILSDLSVEGTERFQESDFTRPNPPAKYWHTCKSLYDILRSFDKRLPTRPSTLTLNWLFATLFEIGVWFTKDTPILPLHIIQFLGSSIQAHRLDRLRGIRDVDKERAINRAKLIFQLQKICQSLEIAPETKNEHYVLQEVISHIREVVSSASIDTLRAAPTLLGEFSLNPDEERLFNEINESFRQDYRLRRRMLLKRLDVTIKAFLWGKQIEGREEEVSTALSAQRVELSEEPKSITLKDVIAAPASLLHEHSKRVVGDSLGRGSVVKSVIIGTVPDRGGRAYDTKMKIAATSGHGGYSRGGGGKQSADRGDSKGRGGRGDGRGRAERTDSSSSKLPSENAAGTRGGGESKKKRSNSGDVFVPPNKSASRIVTIT